MNPQPDESKATVRSWRASAAQKARSFRLAWGPLPSLSLVALLALVGPLASSKALAQELPEQASTEDDIPGELAIDLKDNLSDAELDDFAKTQGLALRPSSVLTARTRIVSTHVADVLAWVRRLQGDPRIEHVEPVAEMRASWIPNDPLWQQQWHLDRVGAPGAWAYSTGRGVVVAVVDTGVACEEHGPFSRGSDLAQSWCLAGFNLVNNTPHANDDNGHGTHVAGTIAQSTDNALGAAGLAFHARLLPVKVLDERGFGTTLGVADGVRYAADAGAHVINMSLGGRRASRILFDAVKYARSKGVVVVAAAGNNGLFVEYPAAYDGVIAVSATDSSDKLAVFSSRGPSVDIAAPGVQVLQQTICNRGRDHCERFAGFSGTSMATPHVAGAAALLMSVGVENPSKVEEILGQNARVPEGEKKGGPRYGAGILDISKAVSSTVWSQVIWRFALGALLGLAAIVRIHRKKGTVRKGLWAFVLTAIAFGPGLFFFAPLVTTRIPLIADLLARPIPEWDLLIGVSVHRWLPLAHFFVPLGLSAVGFGFRWLRPVIAGAAVGTGAYLLSVPLLGLLGSSFSSQLLLTIYALLNAAGCIWLAALNLDARDKA